MFKAIGIEILLSEGLITLSRKKPLQIKIFSNENTTLENYKLIRFIDNPMAFS